MSYYFPFGASETISIQNISYSLSATTASVPTANTITVITASYAATSKTTPPDGFAGINVTLSDCQTSASLNPTLLVSGSSGSRGPTGSKGVDVVTCPDGTVRCISLETSLSAQYNDGVTRGVNYYQSSGSQFSIVCMQIPTGCSPAEAESGCPDYLVITSPSIP